MCGIYGASTLPNQAADEIKLRWLAVENKSRGKDSTGIYTVKLDKNRSETLYKDAIPSDVFIKKMDFKQAVKGACEIIGHTRQATVGMVNKDNSHPFTYSIPEKVVGVHNGFVIQEVARDKFVGKDKEFEKDFEVDSQYIFAMLSKRGGDYKVLT